MATPDSATAYIISRMQADIEFLVSQGVISSADGQVMSRKLPSSRQAPTMPIPAVSPSPAPAMTLPRRVVPPPPPARQLPQARALWPYNEDRQEEGDLTFTTGEMIEVLEEVNADWWRGKNSRGEIGLFPANHVESVTPAVAAPAVPPAPVPAPPYPGGRMVAPIPNEKAIYNPPVAPAPPQELHQGAQPPKKHKFGKFGNTMAQSAAGGVGFGAGAAIGSGLVNAIF